MRISDMLILAVSTLWQQKVRTLLTVLGVVFGSFVLAASLSINHGVQKTIDRFVQQNDALQKIDVRPDWSSVEPGDQSASIPEVAGKMSDATRARLHKALQGRVGRFRGGEPKTPLTADVLNKLEQLPHVEAVVPAIYDRGFVEIDGNSQPTDVTAIRPNDEPCKRRLLAGRLFDSPTEHAAIVSELLLYRLGLLDEENISSALGKKLRLEFHPRSSPAGFALYLGHADNSEPSHAETVALDKLRQQLAGSLEKFDLTADDLATLRKVLDASPQTASEPVSLELPIVGVVRLMNEQEEQNWDPLRADADVILPSRTAADLQLSMPTASARGNSLGRVTVVVDRDERIKPVVEQIRALGLGVNSALEYVEQQRLMYALIFGGMTCVAAVALLVAALGIANTMLISVLERTREIGIMKALGARNGQLQIIFVVEGALIGLVGSGLGLLLAWACSFPGDAWVRSTATRDLKFKLDEALFIFPAWLQLTVLSFAVAVTAIAAIYPARRAARIDPVAALRHE
jgi:putative ABC transport system permease protein